MPEGLDPWACEADRAPLGPSPPKSPTLAQEPAAPRRPIERGRDPSKSITLRKARLMNHATRSAVIIGLTIGWLSSLAHATSWIIELTNGRELTTTHVWEDGEELKFFTAQGTGGVPRTSVKRITPSAKNLKPESDTRHEAGVAQSAPEQKKSGNMQHPEGASAADREKKLALTSQLEDARKKYVEATAAKHPASQKGALDAIRAASKKLYALADEVKEKHGGVLPAWWNE
jgi:hypothetical protein